VRFRWLAFIVLFAALCKSSSADCIPFTEAQAHIGETQCVTGKVLRVKEGTRGVTFFDFCEDFRVCPFTVVIFPGHLRDIGDVRQLKDRIVEIHGQLREYDGRAEIVLSQLQQLAARQLWCRSCPRTTTSKMRGITAPETSACLGPRRRTRKGARHPPCL